MGGWYIKASVSLPSNSFRTPLVAITFSLEARLRAISPTRSLKQSLFPQNSPCSGELSARVFEVLRSRFRAVGAGPLRGSRVLLKTKLRDAFAQEVMKRAAIHVQASRTMFRMAKGLVIVIIKDETFRCVTLGHGLFTVAHISCENTIQTSTRAVDVQNHSCSTRPVSRQVLYMQHMVPNQMHPDTASWISASSNDTASKKFPIQMVQLRLSMNFTEGSSFQVPCL